MVCMAALNSVSQQPFRPFLNCIDSKLAAALSARGLALPLVRIHAFLKLTTSIASQKNLLQTVLLAFTPANNKGISIR